MDELLPWVLVAVLAIMVGFFIYAMYLASKLLKDEEEQRRYIGCKIDPDECPDPTMSLDRCQRRERTGRACQYWEKRR